MNIYHTNIYMLDIELVPRWSNFNLPNYISTAVTPPMESSLVLSRLYHMYQVFKALLAGAAYEKSSLWR